jgi:hypothetical protein
MKRLIDWLRGNARSTQKPQIGEAAPSIITVGDAAPFKLKENMPTRSGFPLVDWHAVEDWISRIQSADLQAQAWSECERGWLLHLRDALGPHYRYDESTGAAVVSSLDPQLARKTLGFIDRTLKRILLVMEELASVQPWGRDILVVLDDVDTYYQYVSNYGPESGEFSLSAGMFISRGCSHFVTRKNDLQAIEPTIAHEMTHSCVSHLPLPLWLNEGLAVNMERRLTGYASTLYTPLEMHNKHLEFWGSAQIQEFWQGKSFQRMDDGNMLSYDLARILIANFGNDWPAFKQFVLSAHFEDGGAEAAKQHLGTELGGAVAAIFEKAEDTLVDWNPQPELWKTAPDSVPPTAAVNIQAGPRGRESSPR